MTERSSVASLSKRTSEGTFRPVPPVMEMAAMSGPRDEADDQIGTAVIIARDHQRRAALVAREVGEREPSKNDAAEREHSTRRLNQVGVRVEFRFLGQPVETPSGLCNRGHREFIARSHLDQYMHPRMRWNAAAGEFGRDLASFGVEDDL